ncbi:hypothetical protein ACJMK2_032459 [Sinanodonta woodiana]|uniref:NTF2-related export protein n=1 Tax=Sinanodonta woodiana TaxID=1069815 RepID=A0ABD3X2C2_SINWO
MTTFPEGVATKVDIAVQAGEEFYNLYYETFDKKRHLLAKLYMDTAKLVWNGNPADGKEAILKFFENLPSSEHKIDSLDCHPLIDQVSGGQMTIMVKTYGTVEFSKNKKRSFQQTFMLTSQNNKWMIVSDCMRFQE